MKSRRGGLRLTLLALISCAFVTASAQTKKEFRYTVGPKASIIVVNRFGPVSVRPSGNNQVIATATLHSAKAQIEDTHNPSRVELRTQLLQNATPQEGAVDYDLQVPADALVNVHSATGTLSARGMQGEVTLVGEAGPVIVKDTSNGHVHVKTLNGSVTLTNLSNGNVDVTSIGGDVNLNAVTGPSVNISTGSGKIVYVGDFGANGTYSLSNHSGDIDVTIPQNASVDITARSVLGSVQNDFPLAQKAQPSSFAGGGGNQGRSFAGTSNSGSSSIQLRSFSGKIRLKKQ